MLEIEFKSLGNIGNNLVRFPSLIDCYEFGAIVINDRMYTSNIIVCRNALLMAGEERGTQAIR